jgi:hypothetical protein
MAASGKYRHLTGRSRAEQEWILGEDALVEHPVRADFVDDGNLVDVSDFVDSGLPVVEDATPDEKAAQEAAN